jgi:hypothetical protein
MSWLGLAQGFPILSLALARLSLNPNLMITQDAVVRTRLALLQRVVPFDVAGVGQLLISTIR